MDYGDATWGAALESRLRSDSRPRARQPWGNVQCEPGWSWSPTLTDYDLWFARSGVGEATINGRRYEITPMTVLLLRPGDRVAVRQDPQRRLAVVYSHFSFGPADDAGAAAKLSTMDADLLPARVLQVSPTSGIDLAMLDAVRAAQAGQPFSGLEADLALCRAILGFYREDAARCGHPVTSRDGRVQSVVDMLRTYPGRRYSLAEAAERARLSPAHFSTLFHQEVGTTFRQFMLVTRLDRAARLLTDTPMSVAEISEALGYSDSYLFSRQFKARFGIPPSTVRSTGSRSWATRLNGD